MLIVESGYFRFKTAKYCDRAILLFKSKGYNHKESLKDGGICSYIDSGNILLEFKYIPTEIMDEIAKQIPSEHLDGKRRERINVIDFNRIKPNLDEGIMEFKKIDTVNRQKRAHAELIMQWVNNPDINVYIWKRDSKKWDLDENPQWLSNEIYVVGDKPENPPPQKVQYSPNLCVVFNEPLTQSPKMNELFYSMDLGIGVYSDIWENTERQIKLLNSGFIHNNLECAEMQYHAIENLLILDKK